MSETGTDNVEARRRKLWVLSKEVGLTDAERIELAQYILRRDLTSWRGLDDVQVTALLHALEGFQLIRDLMAMRPEAL